MRFYENTFCIIMCLDTSEPIYFKLGMMLNASDLSSLNYFDVHSKSQGYRNLCSHSVKFHEATQMFVMVDYVRMMAVKESCK